MSAEEDCGSRLFLSLPDDVLALISAHLRPVDLCSLALCCRGLRAAVAASEKAWLAQCRRLGPPPRALPLWREGVRSYRALCRFLAAVAPLLGVWVHQNPELGNVVCVLWGFLSVVGVRIIPQELGPLGLDAGPLLWAPVFEILADGDGSPSCFFLHGRGEGGEDCVFPGAIQSIDSSCNVLLLEVDVGHEDGLKDSALPPNPVRLPHSRSSSVISNRRDPTFPQKLRRSDTTTMSTPSAPPPLSSLITFCRLPFSDRRRLLNQVAARVRLEVPTDLAAAPLFDRCHPCDDAEPLALRWSELVKIHRQHGGGRIDRKAAELAQGLGEHKPITNGDLINHHQTAISAKSKVALFSMAAYLRDGLMQVIGRSNSTRHGNSWGSLAQKKHAHLHQFLTSGDRIGLSLRTAQMRTYRVWPDMPENWFALYKLPMQVPAAEHEHAGLWGGTFGWPPGRPSEDKPGKALFFLLLSYEEVEGRPRLIATKILEGTHYVLHPNGSAMFVVKAEEASSDPFPWEEVEVKQSYTGEGIASGYGFRYPGYKPGSLFVLQNGLLAFVWKESKSVLTMQRIDLQELLRRGERVQMLPPVPNFAYLTKSYSNVFASFQSNSYCSY